ncbi:MAG TPA: lamin tail domain-containing protein, partial [Verrucomicrobiae bacterium]|nr:lamin tail domain-containing protein [Verrucomicrobiae bacterium]
SYLPKGRGAVAVFETVTDVGYPEGTRLIFTLRHGVSGSLTLGKFRLAATVDHRSQFGDGLTSRGDILANWVPLHPLSATAAGGAAITINPDGTLLVGGTNPTTNTYVVTVVTSLSGITGFRLEALEDGSLPSNGPGRAGNGNAVLTDFVVQAAPATISHLVNGPLATTLQTAMLNVNASAYWRSGFNVDPGLVVDRLLLRVRYEDGFIAYLNGQEIARRNAPASGAWNAAAAGDRPKSAALAFEEVDVSAAKALLTTGANVLAVHALNSAAISPDFEMQPELIAKMARLLPVVDTLTVKARVLSGLEWSALQEGTFSARSPLRFSEIMYDPPGSPGLDGDEFEFLEIQNVGAANYALSGFTFTSGINFTFPNGSGLGPGQYFLLARNPVAFASRYPGVAVDGVYSGRLDNQGETIALSRPFNGGVVLSLTYDNSAAWPQATRGLGFSLVPIDPAGGTNLDRGSSWRASSALYGSPAAANPAANLPTVRVNEILTASTTPQTDFVELFNPTASPASVGGWFLTDDPRAPMKFRIPGGTTIAPGGFAVFTESDFNLAPGSSNSFSLSSHGESVFLFSCDANTNLTGYSHGLEFEPAAAGVSFGLYVNSMGEEQFPALQAITTNAANTGPRVGPVVFGEIHYHPTAGGDEFVELRNITGSAVDLFDPLHPTNTWQINGLGFAFPSGVTLPANGVALVVSGMPAAFRAKYGVPAQIQVFGPAGGALQDSGERLELKRPDVPDTNGLFYITVDAVRYNDRAPWPILADGFGP